MKIIKPGAIIVGERQTFTARETPNKMKTGGARRMPKDSGND